VEADKRHLAIAGLMSAFEKIWVDAWSARMAYILQNTLAALLEHDGATILGINRMYTDKMYRKNVIASVTDPTIRMFWTEEFTKYTDKYVQEATPAIQNKVGQFASNALIRNVIGQDTSSFDIRELMDNRKIFIVNLSKGRVGEGNANLLGSMLVTKIYLAAMSRADVRADEHAKLPPFYLYVDEFQNFANKSFAEILSEARKYKLGLTIAHQYIEQMEEEVRAAVFGNVGTMISFRVGAYDAEVLEKEFAPVFTMENIVNLGPRQVYLKLMIDSVSSSPFSASTLPPVPQIGADNTEAAIAYSRATYSQPREEVEQEIDEWSKHVFEDPEAEEKEKAREERRAQRDAEEAQMKERMPRSGGQYTRSGEQGSARRRDDGGNGGGARQRENDRRTDSQQRNMRDRTAGDQRGAQRQSSGNNEQQQRNGQRESGRNGNVRNATRREDAPRRTPRDVPSRKDVATESAPSYTPKEKSPDELRNVLARIAKKDAPAQPATPSAQQSAVRTVVQPATEEPSRTQAELQQVLSAFKQKSAPFEKQQQHSSAPREPRSEPRAAQSTPPQQPRQEPRQQTSASVHSASSTTTGQSAGEPTPQSAPAPQAGGALTPEEMRKMLGK
jgi:tRNA isopentenyl-2-thiomethyl-A-37 hydroxylase MiaE